MNIDSLTIGEAKQLASLFGNSQPKPIENSIHAKYIGQRVLIRTFSAGVHIGTLAAVDQTGMQAQLKDALSRTTDEDGGLSLSVVATSGIKGGRLNRTPEVGLTNCIEFIPTTTEAEKSYVKFIED